jgi:Esterase-like activity of phytase
MSRPGLVHSALLVVSALALSACASRSELRVTPVGRFDFEGGDSDSTALLGEELSGLARIDGDHYIAVSDEHACLHRLRIEVDSTSGAITAAGFEGLMPLSDLNGVSLEAGQGLSDREGIVYDAAGKKIWVSHETAGPGAAGPAIGAYGIEDGRLEQVIEPSNTPALAVFAHIRSNRGFESLTRRADRAEAWTANEEALTVDGPEPSDSSGTRVRLVRMDGAFRPLAQYAYDLDPLTGRIAFPPLAGHEASGISDLLVLPDGALIVLERMFAGDERGFPQDRIRLYQADWKHATDVSKGALAQGLAGKNVHLVEKRRLAELMFPLSNSNFEGMALGPRLTNGDWSLILIADNNAGTRQALYALRLSGVR